MQVTLVSLVTCLLPLTSRHFIWNCVDITMSRAYFRPPEKLVPIRYVSEQTLALCVGEENCILATFHFNWLFWLLWNSHETIFSHTLTRCIFHDGLRFSLERGRSFHKNPGLESVPDCRHEKSDRFFLSSDDCPNCPFGMVVASCRGCTGQCCRQCCSLSQPTKPLQQPTP